MKESMFLLNQCSMTTMKRRSWSTSQQKHLQNQRPFFIFILDFRNSTDLYSMITKVKLKQESAPNLSQSNPESQQHLNESTHTQFPIYPMSGKHFLHVVFTQAGKCRLIFPYSSSNLFSVNLSFQLAKHNHTYLFILHHSLTFKNSFGKEIVSV